MNRRLAQNVGASPRRLRFIAVMTMLTALAGCGSQPAHHAPTQYNPSRYYPPPGSPGDPWGPYIKEASARFGVPELWVRRVMRQESGGQEDVISWAGAMGLMQVMPETYDDLRGRYNLGDDPFDPHNNILAGTAYLREMYDRFGSPGFLAAYNAGPNRLDRYLNNGTPLPAETTNYVASIAPYLGSERPMSGPLAVYAGGGSVRVAAQVTPSGCDVNAAYDPSRPCAPSRPVIAQPVVVAANTLVYGPGACDPDAAYDPTRPCQPMPSAPTPVSPVSVPPPAEPSPPNRVAEAVPLPAPRRFSEQRPIQERIGQRVAFVPGPAVGQPPGRWAIQVGTFANLATSEAAAEKARALLPDLLQTAKIELPATTPFGSQVAFRARLFGLSQTVAADACSRLNGRGVACITVPPTRDSF